MKEDERNALLFAGAFLQEVKDGKRFVEQIMAKLESIERRVAALESRS